MCVVSEKLATRIAMMYLIQRLYTPVFAVELTAMMGTRTFKFNDSDIYLNDHYNSSRPVPSYMAVGYISALV